MAFWKDLFSQPKAIFVNCFASPSSQERHPNKLSAAPSHKGRVSRIKANPAAGSPHSPVGGECMVSKI